jgi:RNA polymerase sigma-70 factor (sigma-E family)
MTIFGRKARNEAEFEHFVRSGRAGLTSTAYLLCAGDHHLAEDLVQTALVKTYLAWGRVRTGHPGAFARRVLYHTFIDHTRRTCVVREQPTADLPERAALTEIDFIDPALVAALTELPTGQRMAVVLRHVNDLSVEEAAATLGCSPGTVKSQTARGLDKLRTLLDPEMNTHQGMENRDDCRA